MLYYLDGIQVQISSAEKSVLLQNPDTSLSSEYDDFNEGEVTRLGEEEVPILVLG